MYIIEIDKISTSIIKIDTLVRSSLEDLLIKE
jgi:hypothetical protein